MEVIQQPLINAILYGHGLDVVEAFLKAGADPLARNDIGDTALLIAMFSRHPDQEKIVMRLLTEGAELNARDLSGATALHWAAAKTNNADIVQELLWAGARVDTRDMLGKTALMYAAKMASDPQIIRVLLEAGADGGLRDEAGMSAFDHAQYNSELFGTDEYWELSDARF